MELRNRDFFTEISEFLVKHGDSTVLAVIDEQPTKLGGVILSDVFKDLADKGRLELRWNKVTMNQLKLLSWAAEKSTCLLCEITYGGASTEQISGILSKVPPARHKYFNKNVANSLKDPDIRAFVKKSPDNWVVMGFHTNACVAATCGAGPLSGLEDNGGLLQYGKKVYTADSVLHPEPPVSVYWGDVLKDEFKALVFYYDLVMPGPPVPAPPSSPPPDD